MLTRALKEESVCYCNHWKANLSYSTEWAGYHRAVWSQINLLIFWGHLNVCIWAFWGFPLLLPHKMRQHFFLSRSLDTLWKQRPICPKKATASSRVSGLSLAATSSPREGPRAGAIGRVPWETGAHAAGKTHVTQSQLWIAPSTEGDVGSFKKWSKYS